MERNIAEIFSYSESSLDLWEALRDMYGNQNNSARIFQIQQEVNALRQDGRPFVSLLGNFKSLWSELEVYRPHTVDPVVLKKRTEEDRVFQVLASLGSEFEDLRCHILMSPELPSLKSVCSTIQREEVRRKVMIRETVTNSSDTRAYIAHKNYEGKSIKGKRLDLKCEHCNAPGHTSDRCWVLHPELKPKFTKDKRGGDHKRGFNHKANVAAQTTDSFFSNPMALLKDFTTYVQEKRGQESLNEAAGQDQDKPTALLSKFAGFLADSNPENNQGIFTVFTTALEISNFHDLWVVDSGASNHMSNKLTNLYNFRPCSSSTFVSVADGKDVPVQGKGKTKLVSKTIESEVLYVPSFPVQLLSVQQLTSTLNCDVLFTSDKVLFQDRITKKTIGEGFQLHGLFYISSDDRLCKGFQASLSSTNKHSLWHQRLGHPSESVFNKIHPSLPKGTDGCDICHYSKSTRLPFNLSLSKSSEMFELVHSDVWGPFSLSIDGFKYFVTFIDDFSKVTWVYLLKSKSEVFECFKDFHRLVITHFSAHIKTLRTDNGTEYTSHNMKNYLISHGIVHQTSCVNTPQQNGVAERKNRDLLEKTRAIMMQMNVPKHFWSYGVLTATYLINRLPSRVLDFLCPLEVLQQKKPDLSHLKVFGCTCFVHLSATQRRDKLDPRAVKCVFLGYSQTQKGYRCYDTTAKRLFVSRDVQFVETSPIFENSNQGEILSDFVPLPEVAANIEQQSIAPTIQHPTEASVESTINQVVQESAPNIDISEQTTLPRRNPPRERHPPAKFRDYIAAAVRYPPEKFLSYQNLSTSHLAYLTTISSVHEPKNFHEANSQPMWRKSMDDELKALEETNTWNIVHLPPGKHVVGCRWVYRFKFNPDGSIERPKSRVVAQGFTQHFGVDYKETFAPVAKMSTVKVLLSVAANHGWSLSQMDVKNAFLHGELEEEVYMKIPPGHPLCGDPSRVCKLNKSIYGLKQSPRAWHAKLSSTLEDLGFTRSSADSSLYVQTGQTEKLMVLIYVDDLIITGSNADSIAALKKKLQGKFPVKDLGPLKYFLGIEVATSRKGLFLNQRKYTIDLLRDSNMLNSKPANTPFDSKLQLDKLGDPLDSPNYYQKLVGKLIYLTITRPDISFAVSLVSQYMHAPTVVHLCMVKRILRYLKKTIGRGIVMRRNGHIDIIGFSDSDWAGNTIDRRSTTGYCMFVRGNLVSWKSKKQPVVARSSAEAEYRAMAAASCEMVWLKNLLTDLGFSPTSPMKLFCDNQAAMHIAANPVFHERTKHIEVDCHFIRQQVQSKVIQTHYIRSSDQLADAFTKVLSSTVFHRLMFKLGSIDPLAPA
ncbi:Retrovirus-related Pol polyprotein from transposon TNT 1-94 [Vitis vinifera]|uniref:Retrovirus-related Pol polyprotein from transposon TNT 1-94 n=1 Tax=Vitis vinifera TaxID=29760 RepID=A0A438EDR2_VITVI|nr:Retrovirus-related Pol polyprotein from transposon TNT 1-94 [Vitis vinifera]